ncbi:MAG: hypothetical protein WBB28_25850 [Crinalium sp.]
MSNELEGLATGAYARKALVNQFLLKTNVFQYEPLVSLDISETTLKKMIDKYSEQLIYKPIEEIKYWFALLEF